MISHAIPIITSLAIWDAAVGIIALGHAGARFQSPIPETPVFHDFDAVRATKQILREVFGISGGGMPTVELLPIPNGVKRS